jgi:glycosyltransferase involved in cell wall biosynthesis
MVFLFVGRFVEKKGLLILKQLAFRFPSIHWAFAGWGPLDPASWQLPNVSVWRGRSGEQIADLYRAADLVILPSRGEGFPLVVQEAMACGTLVLLGEETARASTEAGPWLLTARVDQNESDVVNIWTEKIKTLMENSDWMTPRSGVESFARRHWNWDACASAYWEIFQSVLRKQDTQ